MADRTISLRQLIHILGRFGVQWVSSRGKGSHGIFVKHTPEGDATYPVPASSRDVLVCYVRGCRKKFKLTAADGVSDRDFYAR